MPQPAHCRIIYVKCRNDKRKQETMWSEKEVRIVQNEFGRIFKNVSHKKWRCLHYGCNNTAINSHLLQKNGILNNVSEEGKVVTIKLRSIFSLRKGEIPLSFQKIGVNETLSYDIFCQRHDTNLFREIEDGHLNYDDYRHCALFFYRSICAEIRIKELEIEKYNQILNSEPLNELDEDLQLYPLYEKKMMLEYARMETEAYHSMIYDDISNHTENFIFKSFDVPIKGIYASSISSMFLTPQELASPELPDMFFIQLIPMQEKSRIMFGYHKQHENIHYKAYIERWRNVSKEQMGYMLTGILIQISNWGMSPSLYERIKPNNVKKYYNLFWEDCKSLNQCPNESFNLFEGIF